MRNLLHKASDKHVILYNSRNTITLGYSEILDNTRQSLQRAQLSVISHGVIKQIQEHTY